MDENAHGTDERLIELFFARNEEAISQTEARYGKYLRYTAGSILHNGEDSEECVNDAYLALWNSIPPERPRSFKAYVTRLVRNISLDLLKKKGREKRSPGDSAFPLDELAEYLGCPDTVEKEVDDRILQQTIDRFVASLSGKDRFVFECRYYCCDSVTNIARSLKTSEAAVYKRLNGIRSALKKTLETGGYDV